MSVKSLLQAAAGGITYLDCCNYWRNLNLKVVEDYSEVLDNFRVLFTRNTACIEGEVISYHNTKEIFEEGSVTNFCGSLSTIISVHNQKILFPIMISDIVDGVQLNIDIIKEYHKLLMSGLYNDARYAKGERAGEFKKGDYSVGLMDVGSFPEDVEMDLKELLTEISETDVNSIDDIIKTACYFHLRFEQIHPFADGNGRLGRALMNYYLMLNGLPPIVIFDEDKDAYYLGLEVFDRTEEISGFVLFVKEQMVATWKNKIRAC